MQYTRTLRESMCVYEREREREREKRSDVASDMRYESDALSDMRV